VDWQSVWLKMSWQARSRHAPDSLFQLHELDWKHVDRLRLQHLLLNVEVVVGRVVVVAAVDPCVALALVAAHASTGPHVPNPLPLSVNYQPGMSTARRTARTAARRASCRSTRTAPAGAVHRPAGQMSALK
jgi:hypothetical protein